MTTDAQPGTGAEAPPRKIKLNPAFFPELIPEELKVLVAWSGWDRENSKQPLIPHAPEFHNWARINDPSTFRSFEECSSWAAGRPRDRGIGLQVLGMPGYIALDIDGAWGFHPTEVKIKMRTLKDGTEVEVRKPRKLLFKEGPLHPRIREIVQRAGTVTWFSPSGTGLRLVLKGSPDFLAKTRISWVPEDDAHGEVMVARQAFMTVTGRRFEATPTGVADGREFFEWLGATYFSGRKQRKASSPGVEFEPPPDVERLSSVDDLDRWGVPGWAKILVAQGGDPERPDRYRSRSDALWAALCEMTRRRVPREVRFSVLTDPEFLISDHILVDHDGDPRPDAAGYAASQIEHAEAEVGVGDDEEERGEEISKRLKGGELTLAKLLADEDAMRVLAGLHARNSRWWEWFLLEHFPKKKDQDPLIRALRDVRPDEKATEEAGEDGFVRDKDGGIYGSLYVNSQVAIRRLGATLRYDEFADRMLLDGIPGMGPALSDADLNRLHQRVQEQFRFTPKIELFQRSATNLAYENRFHPVREYLDGLPAWDGVRRLDRWLTEYLGAEEKPYISAVGRVVLVAAVRRVRSPGCKFDEVMVLEGEQGKLKSSALRALAVRPEWFHDKVPLHDTTQRIFESIHGKWILEVSELACFGRAQVETLKNVIAQQVDRTRLPYDRIPRDFPRQCIFVGTTNDKSYLRDPTGNRRYWPVKVGDVKLADLEGDRDQLWAEAAAAEAAGEPIRLPASLWAAAGEEQEARMQIDPWEERLEERLHGLTGRIRTEEFCKVLGVNLERLDGRRLGGVLRRLGWEYCQLRFDGEKRRCWAKGTEVERETILVVGPMGKVGPKEEEEEEEPGREGEPF